MPSLNELSNFQDRNPVFQGQDPKTLNESLSFDFQEDISNYQDRNSVCPKIHPVHEDTKSRGLENSFESKSAQAQASAYDQEMDHIYNQSQDHAFNHQESYQETFKDENDLTQDQNEAYSSFNKAAERQTKISLPWVLKLAKTVAFCAQKVGACRDGFNKGRKFILDDLAHIHDDNGQIKLRSVFFNLATGRCTFDKDGNLIERKRPKKEKKASYKQASKTHDFKNDEAQGKTFSEEPSLQEHEEFAENENFAGNKERAGNEGIASGASSKACTRLKLHDLYYTEGEVFTLHLIESVATLLHKRKISDFRSYISTLPRLGEFDFRASGQYQDAIFAVSSGGDRLFALMHPLELLALNQSLIFKIHKLSDLSTKDFNELVMPLISRFAEWVLTLPASEGYHDIGAGGLFIHSLRVFLGALEGLHQNLGYLVYEHKRQIVPAVGLVALSHDLGKLVTDFEIFAENNKRFDSSALDLSLAKFMAQEGSSYLKLKFKQNRAVNHCEVIADVRQQLMHACPQCFRGYSEVIDPRFLRSLNFNKKDLIEARELAQKRRKQNLEVVLSELDLLNLQRVKAGEEPLYDQSKLNAQDKEELEKLSKLLKSMEETSDSPSFERLYAKEILAIEIIEAAMRADHKDLYVRSFARKAKAEIVSYLGIVALQYLLKHKDLINTIEGEIFINEEGILLPRFCALQDLLEEAHLGLLYGIFSHLPKARGIPFHSVWQTLGIIDPYRSAVTWFEVKSLKERGSIFVYGSFLSLKFADLFSQEICKAHIKFLPKNPKALESYLDLTDRDLKFFHSILHYQDLEENDLNCLSSEDLKKATLTTIYGSRREEILKRREEHKEAVTNAYQQNQKDTRKAIREAQNSTEVKEEGTFQSEVLKELGLEDLLHPENFDLNQGENDKDDHQAQGEEEKFDSTLSSGSNPHQGSNLPQENEASENKASYGQEQSPVAQDKESSLKENFAQHECEEERGEGQVLKDTQEAISLQNNPLVQDPQKASASDLQKEDPKNLQEAEQLSSLLNSCEDKAKSKTSFDNKEAVAKDSSEQKEGLPDTKPTHTATYTDDLLQSKAENEGSNEANLACGNVGSKPQEKTKPCPQETQEDLEVQEVQDGEGDVLDDLPFDPKLQDKAQVQAQTQDQAQSTSDVAPWEKLSEDLKSKVQDKAQDQDLQDLQGKSLNNSEGIKASFSQEKIDEDQQNLVEKPGETKAQAHLGDDVSPALDDTKSHEESAKNAKTAKGAGDGALAEKTSKLLANENCKSSPNEVLDPKRSSSKVEQDPLVDEKSSTQEIAKSQVPHKESAQDQDKAQGKAQKQDKALVKVKASSKTQGKSKAPLKAKSKAQDKPSKKASGKGKTQALTSDLVASQGQKGKKTSSKKGSLSSDSSLVAEDEEDRADVNKAHYKEELQVALEKKKYCRLIKAKPKAQALKGESNFKKALQDKTLKSSLSHKNAESLSDHALKTGLKTFEEAHRPFYGQLFNEIKERNEHFKQGRLESGWSVEFLSSGKLKFNEKLRLKALLKTQAYEARLLGKTQVKVKTKPKPSAKGGRGFKA